MSEVFFNKTVTVYQVHRTLKLVNTGANKSKKRLNPYILTLLRDRGFIDDWSLSYSGVFLMDLLEAIVK